MVLLTTNNKFENYLQVYHKYHFELLYKFHEKLSLCYQHINHSQAMTFLVRVLRIIVAHLVTWNKNY